MFKTDNSLHVFVGPNSASANAAFQNDVTASAATGSGSIFVVNEVGAAHSNAIATGELFKIGQKHADGSVNYSPLLKFDDCSFVGKATVARTEQSSVFGFNGASGSVQAINSNRYTLRVAFKNNVDMYSEQSDLHFFEYVSDASATQIEIIDYLAQVMSKNEKFSGKLLGKKRGSVRVNRLLGGAGTDCASIDSGNLATAAVVNGSTHVACGSISSAIISGGVAVGNYIRFDEAAGSTDDQAEPVYKIVEANATDNYIVLDQPYQGATASLEDDDCFIITAADAASDAAGIQIVGLEQEWKLGRLTDTQVTFEVTLDGWGSTTAVADTAAVKGSGHGKEVAELEWFGKGSQGAAYRTGIISNETDITLYASKDAVYDVMEIDATIADPKYAVAGSGVGRCQIVLALISTVNATDGAQANTTFGTVEASGFNES